MAQSEFVHLRVHSEYSIVDGIVRIDDLIKQTKALGMKAVALTDHMNLFAAVKFYQAALRAGIKPIIGADLTVYHPEKPDDLFVISVLCMNLVGYRHLTQLISKGYTEGQRHGKACVNIHWIFELNEGLIACSGGRDGDIGKALLFLQPEDALLKARDWKQHFGDRFYIELQRMLQPHEESYHQKVVNLAKECDIPLIATNPVRFINEEDYDAHEARVCIHEGYTLAHTNRPKQYTVKQFLRSPEEMQALFPDVPFALQNTLEISKRCSVMLQLGQNFLPNFPTPNNSPVSEYLIECAQKGLLKRFERLCLEPSEKKVYDDRLALELDVINNMGFAGYFLIVADFIQWAKDNQIPVGPGRGSGAGSLAAYVLGITDLDPLAYDLLFERFLNPERVSMPDFDVDFCMEGRDRVIEYVAQKYGRKAVSQIITFGTMAAKAVIRDVGRVLSHPYGFVDKVAKLIPFELGMTLEKALTQEEELRRRYEDEEDVKDLIDLALKLEGITRNAGKHAGGVVIAPSELTDFTAIYCEEDSTQWVSQFDKDDVESVGLVKFDFLGLKTLTIIDWTVLSIQRVSPEQEKLDINMLPLDCPKTFVLLNAGKTTAIFQLESRGMKELIHRLQPDSFEEIIALVALFRPGPLQSGMVDDFINRKHGREKVVYPHPDLEVILKPTYGVILYQEQVMQIAQVLANYTLGAADLLRRAMGKKKPEEMAQQREIFVSGAVSRGVEAKCANDIFDLMEKFAGYGFNKSHSAAYALVSYQTAWLKTHHPSHFMASVLTADMDNTDKVVTMIEESKVMGLKVLLPSVQTSWFRFSAVSEKDIAYGLGSIKGIGESAIEAMCQARTLGGPFVDLFDFCSRIDGKKLNKRVLDALIKSGAMDDFGVERSVLMASIETAMKDADKTSKNDAVGQISLFNLFEDDIKPNYLSAPAWSTAVRLSYEKDVLGYYLSGHPSEHHQEALRPYALSLLEAISGTSKKVTVCALISQVKKLITKRGKKLYIVTLEDKTHKLDCVVFSDIGEGYCALIQTGSILVFSGQLAHDDYSQSLRLSVDKIFTPEEIRAQLLQSITVHLTSEDGEKIVALQSILRTFKGSIAVNISYQNQEAKGEFILGAHWRVVPSDECLQALQHLLGEQKITMNKKMLQGYGA